MRQSSYEDEQGRRWAVWLPDGVPDSDAEMGAPLGPPSLAGLGLPLETEVRLHNQLFGRKLFKLRDVKARKMDMIGALQGALRVDAQRVVQVYADGEEVSTHVRPKKELPVKGRKARQQGGRRR